MKYIFFRKKKQLLLTRKLLIPTLRSYSAKKNMFKIENKYFAPGMIQNIYTNNK